MCPESACPKIEKQCGWELVGADTLTGTRPTTAICFLLGDQRIVSILNGHPLAVLSLVGNKGAQHKNLKFVFRDVCVRDVNLGTVCYLVEKLYSA